MSATRREPDAKIQIVLNEPMLLIGTFAPHLGELGQALLDSDDDLAVAVELDMSARPRPGEDLAGASGLEGVEVFLSGLAVREALRLADRVFDKVIAWVVQRRRGDNEIVSVKIYGPMATCSGGSTLMLTANCATARSRALTSAERDALVMRLRPLVEQGLGEWRMASVYLTATKPTRKCK